MTPGWGSVAFVAGFFGCGILLAVRFGRKKRKLLQEYVQRRGWTLSYGDSRGLTEKLNAVYENSRFSAEYVIDVETGERSIYLIDGQYVYRTGRANAHFSCACLVESARFQGIEARVEVGMRNLLDAMFSGDQVEMGNTEFSKEYIVECRDAGTAWRVLGRPAQAVLLEHMRRPLYNPVSIVIENGRAVLLTGLVAQVERWDDLVELARGLESTVGLE